VEDLEIVAGVVVPAAELQWRFEPAGGPGGQHANRAATRAVLRFDVAGSRALDPSTRDRILARLGPAAPGGVVTVVADEHRSQWRNRMEARARLAARLRAALAPEPPPRRPTRPRAAARARRLARKRARGEVKRLRRRPEPPRE